MSRTQWTRLADSIARHLAQLRGEEVFVLYKMERPGEDDPFGEDGKRYVQFKAYGPGMVRCEVVSNNYLPEELRLSVDDLIRLREAGWHLPAGTADDDYAEGSPNLFLDVDVADVQTAAEATAFVFREIWKVVDIDHLATDKDMLEGPRGFTLVASANDPTTYSTSDRI